MRENKKRARNARNVSRARVEGIVRESL